MNLQNNMTEAPHSKVLFPLEENEMSLFEQALLSHIRWRERVVAITSATDRETNQFKEYNENLQSTKELYDKVKRWSRVFRENKS